MLFVNKFYSHLLQHEAWYTRSCLQKCMSFHSEPRKRLPGQNKQLEQSLKYVHS